MNLTLEGEKTNILSITNKRANISSLGLGEENIDKILLECDVDKVEVKILHSNQEDEWYERQRTEQGWLGDSIYGEIKWEKVDGDFLYKVLIPDNHSPYILFKDETLPKISNVKIDTREGSISEFNLKGFAV